MMSNTTSALQHLIDEAQRLPSTTPRDVMRFAIAGYLIGSMKHLPGQHDQSTHGHGGQVDLSNRDAALKEIEDSIAGLDHEQAHVVSDSGETIFSKDGLETEVGFTAAELEKMKGATLTHNHPIGNSFSTDDVYIASWTGMREIRAVTDEYVYSIKPTNPKKGWPDKDKIKSYAKDLEGIIYSELLPKVESGSLDGIEAERIYYHKKWAMLASDKIMNITYTRTPRK